MINIYTDGSSRGNPGPGGYAAILQFKSVSKELTGGFRLTTNNRMELMAIIVALEALTDNKHPVDIYTDSKYVVDSVEKGWLVSWIKKAFKGKKNQDLWMRFWRVYQKHTVKLHWVKGHAGHPENERCDFLATEFAQKPNLPVDLTYEQSMA